MLETRGNKMNSNIFLVVVVVVVVEVVVLNRITCDDCCGVRGPSIVLLLFVMLYLKLILVIKLSIYS